MMEGKKVTVIISGGMDSITLLYVAKHKTAVANIKALSFDYGQKHRKELGKAKAVCESLGIGHTVVDISSVNDLLASSLTREDVAVPEGHYAQETMKQTVVPNRNAIMLSIAYGYAVSNGSDFVLFGAHAGDHFIYPDCRPIFAEALDVALQLGNEGFGAAKILAPFIWKTKSEICTMGIRLGVPYDRTWSCYNGQERPCLKCGTCVERTEAFLDNNMPDPLLTAEEWKQAVVIHTAAMREHEETK